MTQQTIFISKSTNKRREYFVNHFEDAISKIKENNTFINLDNLHLFIDNHKLLLKKGTDQSTVFHKAIYSTFDNDDFFKTQFWINYSQLCLEILEILKRRTGYFKEWSIQRYPTIRLQYPGNVSVFEFHRDTNYAHPLGEINCFYALNKCYESSALQVEKNLGFEDYEPLNLDPGQYALLNTSIYKHGDKINKTKKTRVSMDFRFIPNLRLDNENISLSKKKKLTSDSYFITESALKDLL